MWKKLMKELNLTDSYVSMGLGLLVVLIVGILLFNYFSESKTPTISDTGEQTTEEQKTAEEEFTGELPGTYKVQPGDTLWSISEKVYKSGYNWTDIAKENNLTDANNIEEGQEIKLPNVTPIMLAEETGAISSPTPTQDPVEPSENIGETTSPASNIPESYTVKTGDSLWKISVSIYNDGYRWVEIARLNNLANPDIIHNGNVLTLPR